MLRKLLLLILVVLVVGALGAPYLFGAKAEEIHRQFAQQLTAQGSAGLKSSDFSKGLFKSSARDVIEVCSAAAGCRELVISSVIHHGPIAITGIIDGVAPMRPVQAVMISTARLDGMFEGADITPALPNMTITTVAELDGNSVATLDMPASNHSIKGKSETYKLALGGISGYFTGRAGEQKVKGKMDFPSLKLEGDKGLSLTLGKLSARVDGEGSAAGFIGIIEENIDSITLTTVPQDPRPLTIQDIEIAVNGSRSSDGLSQSQLKAGIRAISAGGREYGPATLEGEALRFNQAAVTRMQKEVEALEKKPPQEALPAIMAAYQKGLQEVLKSRPEINLKSLNLKTPDGDLIASLKLVGTPPGGELNLAAWPAMLQAELGLQIPAVTLWNILDAQMQQVAHTAAAQSGQPPVLPTQDQIGAKVTELVEHNVFVPKLDANAYTLQVAMLEGRLLVNGQENQAFTNLTQLFMTPKQLVPPPGFDMQQPPPTQ